MTILGLAEKTVIPLVHALSAPSDEASGQPAEADREVLAERFARAAWNHLIEPGDRIAGIAIRLLGAIESFELLLERPPAARLAAVVSSRAEAGEGIDAVEAAAALERWKPRLTADDLLRSLRQAARAGAALLTPDQRHWPRGLADLADHAPPALWYRGAPDGFDTLDRSVAIVGARAATGYGEHVAVDLAAGLADRGLAVVSGAAYGIDGAAHRAALASEGATVAVLAGGLDRFYPSGHDQLLARIVDHGLVISEAPCGRAPTRWRFLQRNRLIAAVAQATVVVEAGWRSGSLNTARHALHLGRSVGAVPGPVTSAASAGCHRLLRDYAAVCVTTAAEVAELVGAEPEQFPHRAAGSEARADREPDATADPDGARTRLLDALSRRQPREAEQLAAISGLGLERVRSELGLLELEGAARRGERGWLRDSS